MKTSKSKKKSKRKQKGEKCNVLRLNEKVIPSMYFTNAIVVPKEWKTRTCRFNWLNAKFDQVKDAVCWQ